MKSSRILGIARWRHGICRRETSSSNKKQQQQLCLYCVPLCTVPLCNKQMCVSYSPYTRTGIPKSHVGICMSFECKLTKVWMKMLSKLKVTKVSQNLVCSNYSYHCCYFFYLIHIKTMISQGLLTWCHFLNRRNDIVFNTFW